MAVTWYFLIAMMLITYAVLDGFDFGAGILHLFVAKTDAERREVLGAIGPVWDGNEVWLIASGGVFVFAFPRAYAAAFSGLYLPLMMVLWLLVLRGIAIEFRSKLDHPLWRAAFDMMFAFASFVMAMVLGIALGNLVRGVPVDATGWFEEDLFTDFKATGQNLGAIDIYTALVGLFALVALAAHGATYLVWKTSGAVHDRSKVAAARLWPVVLIIGAALTLATAATQAAHFASFGHRPFLWPLPAIAIGSAIMCPRAVAAGREGRAFLLSCAFLTSLLVATVGTLYPVLLRSTVDANYTLDAFNASSPRATLVIGLTVWIPAMLLAAGYFTYMYRSFRGKVQVEDSHH
ncbi:MAG: Cytochrome d ubiquinol oxidase subunit [Myxococcaceae bacterium]|nr:Cytochrome d ubiquinol oxidase subunit [Myxococcaceae bacterium]